MAESLTHPLFENIAIDAGSGVPAASGRNWTYSATDKSTGETFNLPMIQISPENLRTADGQAVLGAVLQSARRGASLRQDEGVISGTIIPALTRTPTNILGSPADLANALIAGVVDAPLNLGDWALGGFEGEIPSERYLSSDPRYVLGGSEQLARGLETVGDAARSAAQW